MGKKKFIDKRRSATFQLLARDSSAPNFFSQSTSDRVFTRVDTNPYDVTGFADDNDDLDDDGLQPPFDDSVFADAPEDEQVVVRATATSSSKSALPDRMRKEILELGLPDDGYNYLLHLREIKNTGGGSNFYQNSKAKLDEVPLDVKAYDASKVRISADSSENSIYVSSSTVNVRVQKAVDPEVAALLDDSDLSRFGSDVEDLDENFVMQANLPVEDDLVDDKMINLAVCNVIKKENATSSKFADNDSDVDLSDEEESMRLGAHEKPRVRRLLDEQFDMLTLQEYDSDSESDFDDGLVVAEGEALADKLSHALKDHPMGELELDGKYKVPADILHASEGPRDEELVNIAADVLQRCVEYAKRYDEEDQDYEEVVIVEESSDESEEWDCETIVSTYSNLDNHPGRIDAPESRRRKKVSESVSMISSASNQLIALRGKEKLPVDFLPHSRKVAAEKPHKVPGLGSEHQRHRPRGEESKEEKKERKGHGLPYVQAAVKEERREARRAKKEMKGLYKCEAQHAQKLAAIAAPSSIHLM
ncbi:hypothetical protein Syun_017693 [Stephania yunnanensis]|uniref:Protein LTV1 homolog n=1 Tax=Stephania yunnanensis TaxID=152371 RepID=A0AAP0J9P4_9MAGN